MQPDDPRAERFRRLVLEGESEALRALFDESPELALVIDEPWFPFDSPALVHATGMRNRRLVDALLDLGADIEARSAWGAGPYSALHRLVDGADAEGLQLAAHLVERGAEVDLHSAAGMGQTDRILEILAAEPARASEPGPDGATPLHLAKDAEIAALLLDHGAEIDKRCVDHASTPAMWAMDGRDDVVRLLVERGAKPDLFIAVALDDLELARRILIDEPDAIDVRVRFGESHQHLGFGDKYVWALDGADRPVELARRRERTELYAFLLERSPLDVQLVQASRRGDAAAIDAVLATAPNFLGEAPEEVVTEALYGSVEGARALLRHGADANALDDSPGATALHHAAWRGLVELAGLLLDGGADASVRDRTYVATPLGWAHENGQQEIMDLLLARSRPDIVDAAWLGRADRVREILSADSSLANGLEDGRISPLRSAAWHGHEEVVRVLLEFGADPTIPNAETGKSAAELAAERGHDRIAELLLPA